MNYVRRSGRKNARISSTNRSGRSGSSVVTEGHQCAPSDYTFCVRSTTGTERLYLSRHLCQIADEIKGQPRGLAAMVNKLVGTDEQICSFPARISLGDMRYSE